MTPTKDHILLSVEYEKLSDYIITNKKPKPEQGLVLEVGAEVTLVSKGDKVIFNKHRQHLMELEDENLVIIKQEDVYAKLT